MKGTSDFARLFWCLFLFVCDFTLSSSNEQITHQIIKQLILEKTQTHCQNFPIFFFFEFYPSGVTTADHLFPCFHVVFIFLCHTNRLCISFLHLQLPCSKVLTIPPLMCPNHLNLASLILSPRHLNPGCSSSVTVFKFYPSPSLPKKILTSSTFFLLPPVCSLSLGWCCCPQVWFNNFHDLSDVLEFETESRSDHPHFLKLQVQPAAYTLIIQYQ